MRGVVSVVFVKSHAKLQMGYSHVSFKDEFRPQAKLVEQESYNMPLVRAILCHTTQVTHDAPRLPAPPYGVVWL